MNTGGWSQQLQNIARHLAERDLGARKAAAALTDAAPVFAALGDEVASACRPPSQEGPLSITS